MGGEKQEMMTELAEKIFTFVSQTSTELRPTLRDQTAAVCSQACLFAAVMIIESAYGKQIVDEAGARATSLKMGNFHNELITKIGDFVKTYGVRVRPIDVDGSNRN